jgi:THO complex subunit 2
VAWVPEMEQLDTRRILKRLAKENLKQLGRMVAKIAHANPMTVLRTIVHQIEAYKDMIAPVVDAFKYLTQVRCCVCVRWPFYFDL